MHQLIIEIFSIGFLAMVIGLIISYISMGKEAKNFKHWNNVALSFFLTGALLHIIFEALGWNKWYCKNGNACKST
jgi:hypothetical protein